MEMKVDQRPITVAHGSVTKTRVTFAEHGIRVKVPDDYSDVDRVLKTVDALRGHLPYTVTLRGRLIPMDYGYYIAFQGTNGQDRGRYRVISDLTVQCIDPQTKEDLPRERLRKDGN